LSLLLAPLGNSGQNAGAPFDQNKGTFEFRQVFPGSYYLVAWTNGNDDTRIGGWQRIEVGKQPLNIAFELKSSVNIDGKVEFERLQSSTNPVSNQAIQVMLNSNGMVSGPPPRPAQANADGTFQLKGVLRGLWRLQVTAPNAFLKSAWLGNTDVTNGVA